MWGNFKTTINHWPCELCQFHSSCETHANFLSFRVIIISRVFWPIVNAWKWQILFYAKCLTIWRLLMHYLHSVWYLERRLDVPIVLPFTLSSAFIPEWNWAEWLKRFLFFFLVKKYVQCELRVWWFLCIFCSPLYGFHPFSTCNFFFPFQYILFPTQGIGQWQRN